jgi:ketosteroid isomerase-like protein
MRALRATLLALFAAGLLSGCGTSDSDQVRAKVEQFAKAVRAHDAKTLCQQVLAPSLTSRLVGEGLTCERGIQIFFASVQSPTLSVGRVSLNGNSASALVLAGARCQRLALAQLYLVKTSSGWRISSESREAPGKPAC